MSKQKVDLVSSYYTSSYFELNKFLTQVPCDSEAGRSMVEMLGVLAVMGVLSVGGIAGYMSAMNKHRANELMEEANKRAAVVAAQLLAGNEDPSLAEFTYNDFAGGKFLPDVLRNEDLPRFGIQVNNVPKSICNQLKSQVGGKSPLRMITTGSLDTPLSGCDDNAALAFIFNDDLTTDSGDAAYGEAASDLANRPGAARWYYCTGNKVYRQVEEGASGGAADDWSARCQGGCDENMPEAGSAYHSHVAAMRELCYCGGDMNMSYYRCTGYDDNNGVYTYMGRYDETSGYLMTPYYECYACNTGNEGFYTYEGARREMCQSAGAGGYYGCYNEAAVSWDGGDTYYCSVYGYPRGCSYGRAGYYPNLQEALATMCQGPYYYRCADGFEVTWGGGYSYCTYMGSGYVCDAGRGGYYYDSLDAVRDLCYQSGYYFYCDGNSVSWYDGNYNHYSYCPDYVSGGVCSKGKEGFYAHNGEAVSYMCQSGGAVGYYYGCANNNIDFSWYDGNYLRTYNCTYNYNKYCDPSKADYYASTGDAGRHMCVATPSRYYACNGGSPYSFFTYFSGGREYDFNCWNYNGRYCSAGQNNYYTNMTAAITYMCVGVGSYYYRCANNNQYITWDNGNLSCTYYNSSYCDPSRENYYASTGEARLYMCVGAGGASGYYFYCSGNYDLCSNGGCGSCYDPYSYCSAGMAGSYPSYASAYANMCQYSYGAGVGSGYYECANNEVYKDGVYAGSCYAYYPNGVCTQNASGYYTNATAALNGLCRAGNPGGYYSCSGNSIWYNSANVGSCPNYCSGAGTFQSLSAAQNALCTNKIEYYCRGDDYSAYYSAYGWAGYCDTDKFCSGSGTFTDSTAAKNALCTRATNYYCSANAIWSGGGRAAYCGDYYPNGVCTQNANGYYPDVGKAGNALCRAGGPFAYHCSSDNWIYRNGVGYVGKCGTGYYCSNTSTQYLNDSEAIDSMCIPANGPGSYYCYNGSKIRSNGVEVTSCPGVCADIFSGYYINVTAAKNAMCYEGAYWCGGWPNNKLYYTPNNDYRQDTLVTACNSCVYNIADHCNDVSCYFSSVSEAKAAMCK